MIVLDTNVVSALAGEHPDSAVVSWLDSQPAESIWITSITVFEARYGIAALPAGRRRQQLALRFEQFLKEDISNRVLDFDSLAASAAAELSAERRRAGTPIDFRDTQIAGIVVAHKAALATRNVRHFLDLSVSVVNPWEDALSGN